MALSTVEVNPFTASGGAIVPGTTPITGGTAYANLFVGSDGKLAQGFVQRDHLGLSSVDFDNRLTRASNGASTIDYNSCQLISDDTTLSIDWAFRRLYADNGLVMVLFSGQADASVPLCFDNHATATFRNGLTIADGNLNMSVGSINNADNITAAHFYGDGASITGLSAYSISGLATVATSGNYSDLSGAPMDSSGDLQTNLHSNNHSIFFLGGDYIDMSSGGTFYMPSGQGFTGSGIYTSFVIDQGIITSAS